MGGLGPDERLLRAYEIGQSDAEVVRGDRRFPASHPRLPGAASAVYVFLKRPEGLVFARTYEQYLLARPFRGECVPQVARSTETWSRLLVDE